MIRVLNGRGPPPNHQKQRFSTSDSYVAAQRSTVKASGSRWSCFVGVGSPNLTAPVSAPAAGLCGWPQRQQIGMGQNEATRHRRFRPMFPLIQFWDFSSLRHSQMATSCETPMASRSGLRSRSSRSARRRARSLWTSGLLKPVSVFGRAGSLAKELPKGRGLGKGLMSALDF